MKHVPFLLLLLNIQAFLIFALLCAIAGKLGIIARCTIFNMWSV